MQQYTRQVLCLGKGLGDMWRLRFSDYITYIVPNYKIIFLLEWEKPQLLIHVRDHTIVSIWLTYIMFVRASIGAIVRKIRVRLT